MKRLWWIILLLFSLLPQPVQAYYGAGQVLCTPIGYFVPLYFNGDSTGFGQARDLCIRRGGGSITVGPGMEGVTLNYPANANITVIRNFKSGWGADPTLLSNTSTGTTYVLLYTSNRPFVAQPYPGTRAGIQQALDSASVTNSITIVVGPGLISADSTFWVHGNTNFYAAGRGITTFKRTRFNPSDPTGAGDIFCTAPYRLHSENTALLGGLPRDSTANIEMKGFTIDGNSVSWPTLNPNGPRNFGISLFYVDNPALRDIEIKNTLQTGIQIYGCKNASARGIWLDNVGQEEMLGTRNGINLNGNSAVLSTSDWGSDIILNDIHMYRVKDTAIGITNVTSVNINGVYIKCVSDSISAADGDTFEFETSRTGYTVRGIHISNVISEGQTGWFFTNSQLSGCNLEDVSFTDCSFIGHATAHHTGVVNIKSNSVNQSVVNFSMTNCTFRNINTNNTAGEGMVWISNVGASTSILRNISLNNCLFEGAQGGALVGSNNGVYIAGEMYNILLDHVTVKNCENVAFNQSGGATDTTANVTYRNCISDGAQAQGFLVQTLGTVRGINFINCLAKDTNKSGFGPAYQTLGYAGGQSLKGIYYTNCRAVSTSGTFMRGIFVSQSGGAVLDSIWLNNNDTQQVPAFPFLVQGTVTNLFMNEEYSSTISRLGVYSSSTTGGAIRIVDGVTFPLTVAGVQSAIDECNTTGGGTVLVPSNANIPLVTTPISLKNKVLLQAYGNKTHDNGAVFIGNASTNVKFAIVAGDTAAGQQYFGLKGITIDGNKSTGARIDAGFYSKLNFVGSEIDNCRVANVSGRGIVIAGSSTGAAGSFIVKNTIVNDTGDYNFYINAGARNVVLEHCEADRPGRNTAAVFVDGTTTTSAGNISTTIKDCYGELSDSMSVWLKIDGASAVGVDQLSVVHPTGRFRAAIQIRNSTPGNFGFSPSGLTVRGLYADSDTLIENIYSGEVITTGSDFNNPYRHVAWYTSPISKGSASTNGYRNSNQVIGLQQAKLAPDIASAATIIPHPDGSVFKITGVVGITDVTFLDSFIGRTLTFQTSAALTITNGNHWHLSANFVGNAAGNEDVLTGYVDVNKNFIELSRSIN